MVGVAQLVEPRIVIPVVAGSIPVAHPRFKIKDRRSMYKKVLAICPVILLLVGCAALQSAPGKRTAGVQISVYNTAPSDSSKNRQEKNSEKKISEEENDDSVAVEQTLSIIKPDAVSKNVIGKILTRFEDNNLKIVAAKMLRLTPYKAKGFYAIHKEKPFFKDLIKFMTSGPILVLVLEGENAIAKNRSIMGATDPKKAAAGTIRADFASSVTSNAVHGSDGPKTAKKEIAFFFKP